MTPSRMPEMSQPVPKTSASTTALPPDTTPARKGRPRQVTKTRRRARSGSSTSTAAITSEPATKAVNTGVAVSTLGRVAFPPHSSQTSGPPTSASTTPIKGNG